MKRWQDWAADAVNTRHESRHRPGSFLGAAIRFRVYDREASIDEAQVNDVPFTPIWWWWNPETDEYIMTLWDTEPLKEPQSTYFVGGRGVTIINPERAVK